MLTKSPRPNRKPNVYRRSPERTELRTDMVAAAARAYANTDWTLTEIEKTYGVADDRIKEAADELGLDASHRGTGARGGDWIFRQDYFWDLVHALSTSPLAISTVAGNVGCSTSTARRYVEELGIERPESATEGQTGHNHNSRRLSDRAVREIRRGWEDFDGPKTEYAQRFDGVNYDQVVNVLNRKSYADVD